MLTGIDEVDWSRYEGAYGPAEDAGEILRAIADPDPSTAGEGREELHSTIWHQGTVYAVTVAAVPFLVELATTDGVHERAELLHTIGGLSDPEHAFGAEQEAVRAAIVARLDLLAGRLGDPDPAVRAAAADAVGRCAPDAGALRVRWEVETDPVVRAVLLTAIARHGHIDLLRTAALTEGGPVPAAAGLAYARSGLALPPETVAPIAASIAAGDGRTIGEILRLLDASSAGALGEALATADAPAGRLLLARALTGRFHASRAARWELMPLLRRLLNDPEETVVAAAADAAVHAGPAAAAVADDLARLAASPAGRAPGSRRPSDRSGGILSGSGGVFDRGGLPSFPQPAADALSVLVRLGDPRWRDPLLAAWEAGFQTSADPLLAAYAPAFDPVALAGVRRRIRALLDAGVTGNPVIHAVLALTGWGPDAAPAIPELIAALPVADAATCTVLAAIGPAAHEALPALRETGDIRAGHAVWKLTGDAGPLVTAAADALDRWPLDRLTYELGMVADAGEAAAPLAGRLRAASADAGAAGGPLRGASAGADAGAAGGESRGADAGADAGAAGGALQVAAGADAGSADSAVWVAAGGADAGSAGGGVWVPEVGVDARLAAARVVWRATGDPAVVLPAIEAALAADGWSVARAARVAAEVAPAAGHLRPALRKALAEPRDAPDAARALWRHGEDPASLVEPLLAAVTHQHSGPDAVDLLVEMDARSASPGLAALAGQDGRLVTGGSWTEMVWDDERLRARLRAAVDALSDNGTRSPYPE
ncbi:hypothetical protein [Actinoplanes sp. CA-252034]|uniref:hypothetical protein n=1 Tax=Actinoplanes sp. CA-252034 TaxID=3239906 RepID=UPI003D95A751